ncbi:hypothetical protein FEM48_Zijuj03G0013800 [Ziziphus jujuba var. spinosa]|uniref:Autophagy-related protein 9 n=1 Tax=Ziziphus jujuba var. spinosa TaxID=714518 RepID=A0A978VMC1_ZIZJJ|nr:hypothetical protein FEM48_Zijuj03G0013800 [Ziziphus jujuba var. spinosa]
MHGAQDTLLDRSGRHQVEDCFIQGSMDFIFGDGKVTISGLLNDVPPEIELSYYRTVPSPGSESPSGLLNGESLNVGPIADLDLFFERLYSYYYEEGL